MDMKKAVKNILDMVAVEEPVDERWGTPQRILFPEEEITKLEELRPLPEMIYKLGDDNEELGRDKLGEYRPMQSPGLIAIYWPKIGSFFWHIITICTKSTSSRKLTWTP